MTQARVKISENSLHTEVEVDGQRIEKAVRALRIDASASGGTVVWVELAVSTEVDMAGKAVIYMTRQVRDALVVLGWTPPPKESR